MLFEKLVVVVQDVNHLAIVNIASVIVVVIVLVVVLAVVVVVVVVGGTVLAPLAPN